jgi:hypothetical protein
MAFYREQIIEHPRKTHYCDGCGRAIARRHLYVVGKEGGGLFRGRYHLECWAKMCAMCTECEYLGDCQGDMNECYRLWKEGESDQ